MCKNFGETIKGWDFFALPAGLSLNYKGQDSHATYCGGILTFLIIIGLVIQSGYVISGELEEPGYMQRPLITNYDYD